MKFDLASLVSLLATLVCVLGGLWLVPVLVGSDATPWPQVGIVVGWVLYRLIHRPLLARLRG